MSHFIHIILEGTYYTCYRKFERDSNFLQLLYRVASDTSQDSIFDALYRGISSKWEIQDDIPYPFGDRRECLVDSSWVIDLESNLVTLRKRNFKTYEIRLKNLLQNDSVSTDDMTSSEPLLLQRFKSNIDFKDPTWEPKDIISPRQIAFVGRLLDDFAFQWRHVLQSRYNRITFQRLAWAIIRIVTLDFEVREITHGRPGMGRVMWLNDMPSWKAVSENIIALDRVTVVTCQHLIHALRLIKRDLGMKRTRNGGVCMNTTYLVLSVREIFLYKECTCGRRAHGPVYTKPEPLFNGVDSPSEQAIKYLLLAGPLDKNYISPLHLLPLEIQDNILDHMYPNRVKSAWIACLLSLGSPYRWHGAYRPMKRQEVFVVRPRGTPVEAQIWFDDTLSGLVYC